MIDFISGRREAVLHIKALRHATGVRQGDQRQHGNLPLHLVRGLEVRRVLSGGQMQLLCHGKKHL